VPEQIHPPPPSPTPPKRMKGPPPDPAGVEGAKPKEFRDRSAFMDDDRPDRGRGRWGLGPAVRVVAGAVRR
jgi:hypothetical protein